MLRPWPFLFLVASSWIVNYCEAWIPNTNGRTSSRSFLSIDPTSLPTQHLLQQELGLTTSQQDQLMRLSHLVVQWNSRVNLISRRNCNPSIVWERHILPSLSPLRVMTTPLEQIVDVGTGGGFPGLPLAIAWPHCEFWCVDSVGKKIRVVDDMVRQLGLTNVHTFHGRVENFSHPGCDLVVGRSVTSSLATLCLWTQHLLGETGELLYLTGGDISQEVSSRAKVDRSMNELLPFPVDKRLLLFSRENVQALAAMSRDKIHRPISSKINTKKTKPPRGAWKQRDNRPKQRGYENFRRYEA